MFGSVTCRGRVKVSLFLCGTLTYLLNFVLSEKCRARTFTGLLHGHLHGIKLDHKSNNIKLYQVDQKSEVTMP